ncbi:bifunctional riboflavin kinase/FAD synthetase [Flavisolibacter tropicus]|uniref:Riboflavin biosynthesis protein n=1 Tax=Flavisolibacter tropicus TaxID=1492898 RepID=A0A172TR95_9BACT|nr:bifunctional riboflavin kinase/FAD synthetase [Flavisolibacter tropicus]ANE49404.1 riboflavin biosynthesis protein RibF [Flavisolibacter tropicus]
MQVHHSIDLLPVFNNAVVTIGTFDGVHLGHQQIIKALLNEVEKVNGESIIITFHPHPRKIVQPDTSLQLINTLDEKIELLEKQGIDHLVVVPFSPAFASLSADDYIKEFLIQKFHPKVIVIGYDHHFGKGRKGNYQLLEKQKEIWGYNLIEIPKHLLNEADISSTKVRKALLKSDIHSANKLLGYDFFFEGKVVKGDQLGRELGYPTANMEYTDPDKIHLGEGVYAVEVLVAGIVKQGMLSIGKRPTLNDTIERVEVNIFDFNENLYGETIRVIVKSFLRPQIKYNDLNALKTQLHQDKIDTLKALNN